MARKLLIRDLTLRDGQQSQFATRMNQNQVDRVLPFYKEARFYAMEVWGGAVPDSTMRFLKENPWDRLTKIKSAIGNVSKLTALSRGKNLFGYNPYPDEVIEGFNKNALEAGIDIMRIFDALNDLTNMDSTIRFVKANKGLADCAVCFTVDSHFTFSEKVKRFLSGKGIFRPLFTVDYFVDKAKELERKGADMITIKDMAGLIPPEVAGPMIASLKREVKVPIDFHTHCTPGYGLGSVLMAMVKGVDLVDAVIMNFAGGPAAPAYELIQIFADKLGLDTGIDKAAVGALNRELRAIRKELSSFDQVKVFPLEWDLSRDKLRPEAERLFDRAIEAAQKDDYETTTRLTQEIEALFRFPAPNEIVKSAQIPGGMYTNMMAQLSQANLTDLVNKVLHTVPEVRMDCGCPPLVTPTSQIVGVQAVNCVIDEANDKPRYTNCSQQFINLVKGSYGKTPIPVDPDFRLKIAGVKEETPYDPSSYKPQENPLLPESGNLPLAKDERDQLLLELFPTVALSFLKEIRAKEYAQSVLKAEEAEEKKALEAQASFLKGLAANPYDPSLPETILS